MGEDLCGDPMEWVDLKDWSVICSWWEDFYCLICCAVVALSEVLQSPCMRRVTLTIQLKKGYW